MDEARINGSMIVTEQIPHGVAIFCDDIREEVGGKSSFMGVYGSDLLTHSDFPLVIPRLGLSIIYREPAGMYSGDLEVIVFLPGDDDDKPSMQVAMRIEELTTTSERLDDENSKGKFLIVRSNSLLGNLQLKQEGKIKVRIRRGGHTTNLGILHVKKIKPSQPPATPPA